MDDILLREDWAYRGGDKTKPMARTTYGYANRYHSIGGAPAVEHYDQNGVPHEQVWYYHGFHHRHVTDRDPDTGEWLPARIFTRNEEVVKQWMLMGQYCHIDVGEDGFILPWQVSKHYQTGDIIELEYIAPNSDTSLVYRNGKYSMGSKTRGPVSLDTEEEFRRELQALTDELLEWREKFFPPQVKSASKQ